MECGLSNAQSCYSCSVDSVSYIEFSAGAEVAFPNLLMTHCILGEVTTVTFPKSGALENAKSHSSHSLHPTLPCYRIYFFVVEKSHCNTEPNSCSHLLQRRMRNEEIWVIVSTLLQSNWVSLSKWLLYPSVSSSMK